MSRWDGPAGSWVSDDPAALNIGVVHRWLSTQSYWAIGRPRNITEVAFAHSLSLALFDADDRPVGCCRWVTDRATFAWLCDVFVDADHRGDGLGTFMVTVAMQHPEVQGLRRILGTKDAHGLYAKFGFTSLTIPDRLMEIWPNPPM